MSNLLDVIGIFSTTILAALGMWQSYQGIKARVNNLVSWRAVEKGANSLLTQMRGDKYIPDAIFAAGRGGAVLGGLISNKFYRHSPIPIFMVDRIYHRERKDPTPEILTNVLGIVDTPRSILLAVGINATGKTIQTYEDWLRSNGAEEVRVAVLVDSVTSARKPNYSYRCQVIDPQKLKMPWYTGGIIDWLPPIQRVT
ncbi:MAG: hypothetical protein GY847_22940 [Proteobacteria bacterium]|nr:hypothetical protein [Pseudomonadota bacterium]